MPCQYTNYYCLDTVINENSILYSETTPNLVTVDAGYYADFSFTPTKIYIVNNSGRVTSVVSENSWICNNIVTNEYYYYKANKYNCGVGCTQSETVYLSCLGNLRLGVFYTETYGEDFPTFVYEITETLGRNQPITQTIINIEFNSFVEGSMETNCAIICNIPENFTPVE